MLLSGCNLSQPSVKCPAVKMKDRCGCVMCWTRQSFDCDVEAAVCGPSPLKIPGLFVKQLFVAPVMVPHCAGLPLFPYGYGKGGSFKTFLWVCKWKRQRFCQTEMNTIRRRRTKSIMVLLGIGESYFLQSRAYISLWRPSLAVLRCLSDFFSLLRLCGIPIRRPATISILPF